MKKYVSFLGIALVIMLLQSCNCNNNDSAKSGRVYNDKYEGEYLSQIAYPIGGMGAGMFCVEGTGAVSHMSIRHKPDLWNEPAMFAALHVKGVENGTKVLERDAPDRKKYGMPNSALGYGGATWGLPRFKECSFLARFPFAELQLQDDDIPMQVQMKAWSPFIPTDADNSGLPAGAIEYVFRNTSDRQQEAVFSYNARNFVRVRNAGDNSVKPIDKGFILSQTGTKDEPWHQADFAVYTDETQTAVDHCWFRGGWFDPLTVCWNNIGAGESKNVEPVESGAPGASLFVPFRLAPGETKTIKVYMAWYVPYSDIRIGSEPKSADDVTDEAVKACPAGSCPIDLKADNYRPWYSCRFRNIEDVASYWRKNYDDLKAKTQTFTDAFYAATLPDEVKEAVAANLTILKSPTVFRQYDGRLWCWEGCAYNRGSCHGSCTHVWNYAQAVPHLFPAMERTLRETEFWVSQDKKGHQAFRTNIPIRPTSHGFHSAADGQLGGIMKIYRDWRISGNTDWLKQLYPSVKRSMDYCIETWDPREVGALEEPHHNTYDIEFWGPDGMCTSFYAGALQAFVLMSKTTGEDAGRYETLLAKSKNYMETKLYNGEYFIQDIRWKDLQAEDPTKVKSLGSDYSPEALALLEKEGPKYQYGTGCLSDGVLGSWMSLVCGMPEVVDKIKITAHLIAVHKYNLKKSLREHSNPQRSTFAMGNDGGLLLCSWPKGGKLQLPFVYSDEVWTGIEYQAASHLMFEGETEKGLDIVRTCRDRYDGRTRNPFNEYECGAWYARAMSSYGMIEGLTGVRYDAVYKTLYIDSRIGNDFVSFLSTDTGFGNVGLKNGKPFADVKYGTIDVKKCVVSGKETAL